MVHKMGGDWKKLQARETVEQCWIFHPMYSQGCGSKMVLLMLSRRQRSFEGLEVVIRETQKFESGTQGGDCEKRHRKNGTTDQTKEEKLASHKVLCRSDSGERAWSLYGGNQDNCGGRRNCRETKEFILLSGGMVGRRNLVGAGVKVH